MSEYFNETKGFLSSVKTSKFVIIDVETVPRHWAYSKKKISYKLSKDINIKLYNNSDKNNGVKVKEWAYKKDVVDTVTRTEYKDLKVNQPAGNILCVVTITFDNCDSIWKFTDFKLLNRFKSDLEKLDFINHNAAFDLKVLRKALGFKWDSKKVYCTLIGEWALTRGYLHVKRDLWSCIKRRLGVNLFNDADLQCFNWLNYDDVIHSKYVVTDVKYIYKLFLVQMYYMEKDNLLDSYYRDCEAMAGALLDISLNGMPIIQGVAKKQAKLYEQKIKLLEVSIERHTFKGFNPNSGQQLLTFIKSKTLFPIENTQKDTLNYLSRQNTIDTRLRKFIRIIMIYKYMVKQLNTFIGKFYKYRRVYTSCKATFTNTGRISTSDPNLQNIPRVGGCRDAFGYDKKDDIILIDRDMGQIEPRILAEFTQDKELINCFGQEYVFYCMSGSKLFNIHPSEINKESEFYIKIKTLVLAIMYGMGDYSLAKKLDCTVVEASDLIEKTFSTFPDMQEWLEVSKQFIYDNLYARSLGGTIRRFIPSNSPKETATIYREGINFMIQGSAAECYKESLNLFHRTNKNPLIKPIGTIHDELIIESPLQLKDEALKILDKSLIDGHKILIKTVPIEIAGGMGYTWKEAK